MRPTTMIIPTAIAAHIDPDTEDALETKVEDEFLPGMTEREAARARLVDQTTKVSEIMTH